MSISYDDAAIYALILRAKGKMMRLLGLFQQAVSIIGITTRYFQNRILLTEHLRFSTVFFGLYFLPHFHP